VILAALAAAATCVAAPDWEKHPFRVEDCPQVFRIHGEAPPERALDLVFLPAGFKEEELDVFRCGVALTLEELLTRAPFDRYACGINAYRIDLATTTPVPFPATCGGQACAPMPPVWIDSDRTAQCADLATRSLLPPPARGTPVPSPGRKAGDCLDLDLGVQACPDGTSTCRVMWPTTAGLRRIWRLAACAPAFDIVVVVANSGDWAGGGNDDMQPPLTVITLDGVSAPNTRGRLLGHELGHALGLLDEYATTYPGTTDVPVFHAGRNVAKADAHGAVAPVPWSSLCGTSPCVEIPSCGSTTPPSSLPQVGLYEGAFYQSCGYYRASDQCAMSDAEDPLCSACRLYLSRLFEDMGLERCAPTSSRP
jgi:hypothetical protein